MDPTPTTADTRLAARDSMREHSSRLREQVLDAVRKHGPINCDALEAVLGLSHQTCSARVHELMKAGKILAHDKRPTRTGRMAVAWIAA